MHDLTDNYEKCSTNDFSCDENLNLDVKKNGIHIFLLIINDPKNNNIHYRFI